MKSCITVFNQAEKHEITIAGPIGGSWWDDSGMTEKAFREAIDAIPAGRPITIRINSEGGSVQDGLGIYNAIKARAKDVTIRIDGYAVSIASVIALAGDKVVSPVASIWMIHDPWSIAQGNADDMRKAAAMLEKHGETLAKIYSEETGMSPEELRKKMKDETWFDGSEAVEMGFATEQSDEPVALASLDTKRFRALPEKVAAQFAGQRDHIATIAPMPNAPAKNLAADSPQPQPGAQASANPTNKMNEPTPAAPQPVKAEPQTQASAPAPAIDLAAVIANLNATLTDIRAAIVDRPIAGVQPIATSPRASVVSEGPLDRVNRLPRGAARIQFLKDNWSELQAAQASYRVPSVMGANTTSATITTAMLNEVVTTTLQDQLAPLAAFSRDFSGDRFKPLATVVSKKVTAGGTAQTNATDFEDETNFVATAVPISVTMNRYTAGGHLTAAELNSGYRMEDWAVIKASEISNAIWDVVTALFTVGNFTATPVISAWASFGKEELATLWGQLQKSTTKNLIVDGTYFANLLGGNTQDFNTASGDVRTLRWPGWNTIGYSTRWSAAGANVKGIACGSQIIRCVSGLPLMPASASRAGLSETVINTPVGISVAMSEWFGLAARTDWMTFDVMFGAAIDDATSGVLVKAG